MRHFNSPRFKSASSRQGTEKTKKAFRRIGVIEKEKLKDKRGISSLCHLSQVEGGGGGARRRLMDDHIQRFFDKNLLKLRDATFSGAHQARDPFLIFE
jgi:hypothetical protein